MDDRPVGTEPPLAGVAERAAARVSLPAAAPPRRHRWLSTGIRVFVLLLAAGLAVMVAWQWNWWVGAAVHQRTDDAYLQADLTPLAAQVPGYVRSVPVQDFQRVKAGDLLVEIVDDDYRARLDQAEANVAAAEAALGNIAQQKLLQQTLIKQAEATIQATEADVLRFHLEAVRQKDLLSRGPGSPQLSERATDDEQHAGATLELNRAQLEQQRQQMNVLDSQEKQAQATLKAQQAVRDLAAINLGYTRISAPVDGMVGERQVRPGQYVSTGTLVISLVPLPHVWVVANYMETQMTHIRVGQAARVTVDAFPGLVLTGHVDSWSPGTGSTFALLPPDNATGNFTKVVQRVPVKIVLDPHPSLGALVRPGMSVEPTVDTGAPASQRVGAASAPP